MSKKRRRRQGRGGRGRHRAGQKNVERGYIWGVGLDRGLYRTKSTVLLFPACPSKGRAASKRHHTSNNRGPISWLDFFAARGRRIRQRNKQAGTFSRDEAYHQRDRPRMGSDRVRQRAARNGDLTNPATTDTERPVDITYY